MKKNSGEAGKLYYSLNNATARKLPIFYAQFLDQMLHNVSTISVLTNDEFEKLVSESELLINVNHPVDISKTHLIALNEPKYTKDRKEPEIGIFHAGIDSPTISWEYICPNDRIDFISKIQAGSFIFFSFRFWNDKMKLEEVLD